MSIFLDAQAIVLVADYIGVDVAGKVNAIGAGFALSTIGPNGHTPPQSVAVLIDVPSKYAGEEFALSLELRNETTGSTVQLPVESGQLEALRMQQVIRVERPQILGAYIPSSITCRSQATIAFPTGLPLQPGTTYAWRLEIDTQTRPGWFARFHVLGPPPGPVFGGPAGPAELPESPQPPDAPKPPEA
jgi:hypothetical protein